MTIELNEILAGTHISNACEKAVEKANATGESVHFVFNDTHVTVSPGEKPQAVQARWDSDLEAARQAWLASPEYAEQQKRDAEELQQKMTATMKESASTEEEMRDAKVPWPLTEKQLNEYIESLVSRQHDYGTCVYAMSMAAEAAFNYVSHRLGVTGFQASCADMDFLKRTRRMKGPFMIIKAEDMLYPQYDLVDRLHEAIKKWKPWAKERAKELLRESGEYAHTNVIARWKRLAEDGEAKS